MMQPVLSYEWNLRRVMCMQPYPLPCEVRETVSDRPPAQLMQARKKKISVIAFQRSRYETQ